jgi:hypothetical protein
LKSQLLYSWMKYSLFSWKHSGRYRRVTVVYRETLLSEPLIFIGFVTAV